MTRVFHRLPNRRVACIAAWLLAALCGAGCATTPTDVQRSAAAGTNTAAVKVGKSLYSTNPAVRQAAMAALLKMPQSYTVMDIMLHATFDPNPAVRGDAGAALLFYPHPDLSFYAITLIADPLPEVRKRMAEGLATAGKAGPYDHTRDAGVYLWGLEQDDDASVRAAAAQGLGELGLNDPMGFALEALHNDPNPRVRAAAARGLGVLARAYLAGERGPDWHDPKVEGFLTQFGAQTNRTPTEVRGEEIVLALCEAARADTGEFQEVVIAQNLVGSKRNEQTRWVAVIAADALSVPGKAPRPDIAEAQTAATARVAEAAAKNPVEPPKARAFNFEYGPKN